MLIRHPKLSPMVQVLLNWFVADPNNAIEWCTSVGRSFGEIVVIGTAPAKCLKPSLNTLLQYGLLQQTEVLLFGIRWTRLSVAAGTKFLTVSECADDYS
ncbi:hypothetical protein A5320_16305 [Rheinheimera sp. SA_1]|uniref:hypothetical protein n=1 Tax=Rheinheimera sp. SA_1 TaxID=1827365 RepID=UPI0007FEE7DB|nr:hypothetical protein [Rheinheimera sp. SA_1]OBP14199.1 hypothetical protein A5320_16305 [Rheinheimera sp. SA_1]